MLPPLEQLYGEDALPSDFDLEAMLSIATDPDTPAPEGDLVPGTENSGFDEADLFAEGPEMDDFHAGLGMGPDFREDPSENTTNTVPGVFETVDAAGNKIQADIIGTQDMDLDGKTDTYQIDLDGDGKVDGTVTDANEDGQADRMDLDLDKDTITDTVVVDSDKDGSFDRVSVDSNNDGLIDTHVQDIDDNGRINKVEIDTDADGVTDMKVSDFNEDGKVDAVAYDTDGDGKMDVTHYDHDEDGKVDSTNGQGEVSATQQALGDQAFQKGIPSNHAEPTTPAPTAGADDTAGSAAGSAAGAAAEAPVAPAPATPSTENAPAAASSPNGVEVDLDGDGFTDGFVQDTNADGKADIVELDTDGDGLTDTVLVDEDYDGYADVRGFDNNDDLVYDTYENVTSDLAPTIDIDMNNSADDATDLA